MRTVGLRSGAAYLVDFRASARGRPGERDLVAALAARVDAGPFGRARGGLETGHARVLKVRSLPACLPGLCSSDGVLCVRALGDRAGERRAAVRVLAREVLAEAGHPADDGAAERLALAFEARRSRPGVRRTVTI